MPDTLDVEKRQQIEKIEDSLKDIEKKVRPTREDLEKVSARVEHLKRELLQLEAQRRAINVQLSEFDHEYTQFLMRMKDNYDHQYQEHLEKLGNIHFASVVPFIYDASVQSDLRKELGIDRANLSRYLEFNKELEKVEDKMQAKRNELNKKQKILAQDIGTLLKAEMAINKYASQFKILMKR